MLHILRNTRFCKQAGDKLSDRKFNRHWLKHVSLKVTTESKMIKRNISMRFLLNRRVNHKKSVTKSTCHSHISVKPYALVQKLCPIPTLIELKGDKTTFKRGASDLYYSFLPVRQITTE